MKKLYSILTILFLFLLFGTVYAHAQTPLPNLIAYAHVEDYGDMQSTIGNHIVIGTTGQAKRMEALTLQTDNPNIGVCYEGHIQDIGWQGTVTNGQVAGTKGQAKRIECFKLNLTGPQAGLYDLYYRAHVENYGWLDWAKDYCSSGTSNHAFRCEALEMAIVPKGSPAPDNGSTSIPAVEAYSRCEGENMYLVNMLRKAEGKPYLTGHPELHNAAQYRVLELGYYSHTRPDGRDCYSILHDLYPNSSVSFTCENIAGDQYVADLCHHFYNSWCTCPGHTGTGHHSGYENSHMSHHGYETHENCHANMTGNYKYMAYAEACNIGGVYQAYGLQCFGN